jgi:hypothetical protein
VDRKDETRPGNIPGKRAGFINKNVLIFAFFLVLSFIFWYLNSLGKEIEADIRYPVTYINIPENRLLSVAPPNRLNLYLKGPGYSILRLKITGNSAPVVIDFSKVNYRRVQNARAGDFYIVASGLVSGFNSQLKAACKITSVKPDTLFFSFSQAPR